MLTQYASEILFWNTNLFFSSSLVIPESLINWMWPFRAYLGRDFYSLQTQAFSSHTALSHTRLYKEVSKPLLEEHFTLNKLYTGEKEKKNQHQTRSICLHLQFNSHTWRYKIITIECSLPQTVLSSRHINSKPLIDQLPRGVTCYIPEVTFKYFLTTPMLLVLFLILPVAPKLVEISWLSYYSASWISVRKAGLLQ